jgi:hypothetical protein
MSEVEERFIKNTLLAKEKVKGNVELITHKGFSDVLSANIIASGK